MLKFASRQATMAAGRRARLQPTIADRVSVVIINNPAD